MKKIFSVIKKMNVIGMWVIVVLLLLPTVAAVMMRNSLSWVLELIFAIWFLLAGILTSVHMKYNLPN